MSKAKLPAILLNNDFFLKPRNRKWLADNGSEALVILLSFWTASSQESSCKIRKDEVAFITFPIILAPEKILNILESAVKVGLLDEDLNHFFNSQIVNDAKSFKNKRENYTKGHEKRKKIQDESSLNPERNQNKSKLDFTDTESNTDIKLNTNKEVPEPPPQEVGYVRPGPFKHVRFDPIAWEQFQANNPEPQRSKQIELYEAHIEKHKHKDPQRYQELKREALSGAGCLMGWAKTEAYKQILTENTAKAREQKATQPYQKPQETPRPQPKEVTTSPPRRQPTAEEIARNKKLTQELLNKTTKGLAA